MRRPVDKRLPVLLLTACLIGVLGVVIQRWPDSGPDKLAAAWEQPAKPERSVSGKELDERFQQGVMMLHAGKYDYAVAAFRRVLELSPEMPEAHVNMGFAQFGQGHYAVARDFFRSAIELRTSQVNAYWGLAVSLEALCDIPGAIGAMRSYVHLADKDDQFQRKAQSALWEWEAQDAAASDCQKS
jgi:tetratricopeptide (TPR) repeat protein